MYLAPKQSRSKATEDAFLIALDRLLVQTSFRNLTIEEIAGEAGLSKAAFLRRFGSKREALYVLFARYCEKTKAVMRRVVEDLPQAIHMSSVLTAMSMSLERLIKEDFSANRAMREDFQERLEVHPLTRQIFLECVEMMKQTQQRFIGSINDEGAFSAAQLLISISFDYAFNAMPGLPRDYERRHALVANILNTAISSGLRSKNI